MVVVTALPSMRHVLGADISTLAWTVNAYTLAFAAGTITAAALGDRYGQRRVFAISLSGFTASSAAYAHAPDTGLLILARTLHGLGAATVTPLALTILAGAFAPERGGAVLGICGDIGRLAVAGGLLIGGAVTQGLDWHWFFG